MQEQVVLEGRISVEAALRSGNRDVRRILIDVGKSSRDVSRLEKIARSAGVEVVREDGALIDSQAAGRTHGGVIAFAGERRFLGQQQGAALDGRESHSGNMLCRAGTGMGS